MSSYQRNLAYTFLTSVIFKASYPLESPGKYKKIRTQDKQTNKECPENI